MLKLIPEQREDLQRWAQSRTLPAGDVFRARLILALADGTTYREIARSLKTSLPTIARWKMRFERVGLAGLEGRHLGSKPRAAMPKVQARVIRRVQQKPGDGMWGDGASWIRNSVPSVHEDQILRLDASKARVELGWQPRLRIEAALEWTMGWYRAWNRGVNMAEFTQKQIAECEDRLRR